MARELCSVCGETRLDGWAVCPACGHPYEEPDDDSGRDDHDDERGDDDDVDESWWRA
ncbi:MAG TPA: hypothetical protein VFZ83_01900 [Acidimicrobiia bacterium]|nr:hypothetical protein [Acidimicrobiia bacterium]